jgi:glutamate carboxypeptidase
VWPVGSWPELWREADGKVFGPGVYDMKCGLLFILWMLRYFEDTGCEHPHLEVVIDPDEEVGSQASRPAIDEAAAAADFALVLESATDDHGLKLARRGSGDFFVDVIGRPAHQGEAPELGINAVLEAAHQVLRLDALQDLEAGTTVGPNVISGGIVNNAVADHARIGADVRAWTVAEQQRLERDIRALTPVLDGAELKISGQWNRPPMEATVASREFFERARGIGAQLGLDIEGVAWGGASDANFAAAMGAATLDGFGPIGEGAHEPTESVVIESIPLRLALLTDLVSSLAVAPEEWMSPEGVAVLWDR